MSHLQPLGKSPALAMRTAAARQLASWLGYTVQLEFLRPTLTCTKSSIGKSSSGTCSSLSSSSSASSTSKATARSPLASLPECAVCRISPSIIDGSPLLLVAFEREPSLSS